jgi:hypothetical protein
MKYVIICLLCLMCLVAACSSPSEPSPSVITFPTVDPNAPNGRPGLAPPQPASRVELKMVVMDTAYTKVEVDGKTVLEGQLQPGAEQQFNGLAIRVHASNGAAVLLTPNGLPSEYLGRLGKPSEKVFRFQDGKIYVDVIDPPT